MRETSSRVLVGQMVDAEAAVEAGLGIWSDQIPSAHSGGSGSGDVGHRIPSSGGNTGMSPLSAYISPHYSVNSIQLTVDPGKVAGGVLA